MRLGIEPGTATCKASTLAAVFLLHPPPPVGPLWGGLSQTLGLGLLLHLVLIWVTGIVSGDTSSPTLAQGCSRTHLEGEEVGKDEEAEGEKNGRRRHERGA